MKTCCGWMIGVLLGFFAETQAQQVLQGCTDPAARNFNAAARLNDGSCSYGSIRLDPRLRFRMPEGLEENSGMVWWNGLLWVHNDGGAAPVIHALDSAGQSIRRTITLRGARNVDWEDMTQDDSSLYIADVGNNATGARTDLRIYRVRKEDLRLSTGDISVDADTITFRFEDQPWPPQAMFPNTTDFDTEAMICRGGRIYLFTKQWTSRQTVVYELPAAPGMQVAKRKGAFDAGGLITGAALDPTGTIMVLTGYSPTLNRFIWLLYDFRGDDILNGNRRRIQLTGPGQTESACFLETDRLLLGSERFSMLPDRVEILWLGDLLAPHRTKVQRP